MKLLIKKGFRLRELKRLASAVQLRPWPPHFKGFNSVSAKPLSPLSVRFREQASRSVSLSLDCEEFSSDYLVLSPLPVRFWSAALAENRDQHCPCCDDPISLTA